MTKNKGNRSHRWKASALLFALFIAFLIGTGCAGLLLFEQYQVMDRLDRDQSQRVIDNLESGIELLLQPEYDLAPGEVRFLDLYDDDRDSLRLERKIWGLIEVGLVESFSRGKRMRQAYMLGNELKPSTSYALYLADHRQPLALCGETVIRGKALLPASGVKRAYIEGKTFHGDSLIYGQRKVSQRTLPPLEEEKLVTLDRLIDGSFQPQDSIISGLDEFPVNPPSFFGPAWVVQMMGSAPLPEGVGRGQLLVWSDREIEVGPETALDGIILVAPIIRFNPGFSGTAQAIARDTIIVEEDVHLNYPSILAVRHKARSGLDQSILIKAGSRVEGRVLLTQRDNADRFPALLKLEKGAQIVGQVYVRGTVDLQGDVIGQLTCDRFRLKTPSSVYQNHLLDVRVDLHALPQPFGALGENQEGERALLIKRLL